MPGSDDGSDGSSAGRERGSQRERHGSRASPATRERRDPSGSRAHPARRAAGRAGRRRDLLVGLAVVLPLALLALLVRETAAWLAGVGRWLVGILEAAGVAGPLLVPAALAVVLVGVPLALLAVGTVVRHRYGRRLVHAVDDLVESVPGLGPVYSGLRRSREVLAAPEGQAFAGVVRVELADGVHALAFRVDRSAHETVAGGEGAAGAADRAADAGGADETGAADAAEFGAGDADDVGSGDAAYAAAASDAANAGATENAAVASHVDALGEDDLATVFLPFAPNPIVGGHLVTVRRDRIEPTELTVSQALGVLVGLGSPDGGPEPDVPLESFFLDAPAASGTDD